VTDELENQLKRSRNLHVLALQLLFKEGYDAPHEADEMLGLADGAGDQTLRCVFAAERIAGDSLLDLHALEEGLIGINQ